MTTAINTRYTDENYEWLRTKSFDTRKSINQIVNEAIDKEHGLSALHIGSKGNS